MTPVRTLLHTGRVVSSWARTSARDRIERICVAGLDPTTLRLEVLTELRRVVGFDAYAWPLADPETGTGVAPLAADVPFVHELPLLMKLKYLSVVNRWTALAGHPAPVGLLGEATGGDLARSLVWRGLLRRYEIGDTASTVFTDRHGCWGWLEIWRGRIAQTFDEYDAAFLSAIAGPVAAALRTCQARNFTTTPAGYGADLGPAVVIVDDDLRVTSQTAAAAEWLRLLNPTGGGRPPIPANVYHVAGQLIAREHSVDTGAAAVRVHADGRWVSLRAARLSPVAGVGTGAIAVTIEEASPTDRLEVFGRACGLTPRERELLTVLSTGSDTRGLASHLLVTENTVQDHLKSIFAKTAAHNRRSLISMALGSAGTRPDTASKA